MQGLFPRLFASEKMKKHIIRKHIDICVKWNNQKGKKLGHQNKCVWRQSFGHCTDTYNQDHKLNILNELGGRDTTRQGATLMQLN